MNTQWKIVILILVFVNVGGAKVVMIQSTIRHADRTPAESVQVDTYYPNDPNRNINLWPDGPMYLTNKGRLNAYKLGGYFRRIYGDLFRSSYDKSSMYFQATKSFRTIDTAQLVAAGIFRPNDSHVIDRWNPNLRWDPVPIYSLPIINDTVFYAMIICGNYKKDRTTGEAELERVFEFVTSVKDSRQFLTIRTGANHTRVIQAWMLYHHFAAQIGMGVKLDSWIDAIFPDGLLKEMSAIEYILQNYTDRMKRLMGGVWIAQFLEHANDLINNASKRFGYFYVGNEIQVAAILIALGVFEPHVPDYLSSVIFELHDINDIYHVKIVYINGKIVTDLVVPGCGIPMCPLSTFEIALKNVTMENFDEDCGDKGFYPIL